VLAVRKTAAWKLKWSALASNSLRLLRAKNTLRKQGVFFRPFLSLVCLANRASICRACL
jgi:hypothetical protein